ncbi:MAG: VOC family protein [Chloroflexi bacterium]|nr:VOC family protein [Chloroflexota bacterium]
MTDDRGLIETISAVTLAVTDMARSFAFYESLGFRLRYGGPEAGFTSFELHDSYVNLQPSTTPPTPGWGRVILHVEDVDAVYARAIELGYEPEAPPRDASFGERFFHLRDPDGHELSFARLLSAIAEE